LRKLWVRIHQLLGLGAGSVLAVVGLSGALLASEDAVVPWLNRDVRAAPAGGAEPLEPLALLAALEQQAPGRAVLSLQISSDPAEPVRATLAGGGERGERRALDPYTGQLLEGGARGESFYRRVRELHRWLLAGPFQDRDLGRQIVGACTALGAVLLVSGLWLRRPGRIRSARSWLIPDGRLRGTPQLFNLHAVIGTWALVPLLLMTLTGLQWSYPSYRAGLYTLAGVAPPERGRDERAEPQPDGARALARAWTAFLTLERERGRAQEPGFATATFAAPRGAETAVRVRYLPRAAAHDRALDVLLLDAASGRVLERERYADKALGARLVASIFALHTGSFFGLAGRVVYLLASLGMPFLAVTGWLLWRRRRARARPRRERQPGRSWGASDARAAQRVIMAPSKRRDAR